MAGFVTELSTIAGGPRYVTAPAFRQIAAKLVRASATCLSVKANLGWEGGSANNAAELLAVRQKAAMQNADAFTSLAECVERMNLALDLASTATADIAEMEPPDLSKLAGNPGAQQAHMVLFLRARENRAKDALDGIETALRSEAETMNGLLAGLVYATACPALTKYPIPGKQSDMKGFDLMFDWLLGTAPENRYFDSDDEFTKMLRAHRQYSEEVPRVMSENYEKLLRDGALDRSALSYETGDWLEQLTTLLGQDVPYYLSGGVLGTGSMQFLGSHSTRADVVSGPDADGGLTVRVTVTNDTTLGSATRLPGAGYLPKYQETVEPLVNRFAHLAGTGDKTSQTVIWHETVYPPKGNTK